MKATHGRYRSILMTALTLSKVYRPTPYGKLCGSLDDKNGSLLVARNPFLEKYPFMESLYRYSTHPPVATARIGTPIFKMDNKSAESCVFFSSMKALKTPTILPQSAALSRSLRFVIPAVFKLIHQESLAPQELLSTGYVLTAQL